MLIATTATSNAPEKLDTRRADAGGSTALDRRYHEIGISAVAAAARYHGMAKNPAYAPVSMRWYATNEESAA